MVILQWKQAISHYTRLYVMVIQNVNNSLILYWHCYLSVGSRISLMPNAAGQYNCLDDKL